MSAAPPLPHSTNLSQSHGESRLESIRQSDWMRIGVGGTLLAGSLLLMTGKRKAGLVVTAAGAALAMLEEKELVTEWWNALPGYLDKAQNMLDQAQETIDDLAAKRDKLMSIFSR